ncbi:hypothetical protein ACO0K7_03470 [Undibacterium sp. Ji67W]|uniref:hypothetical protein n=1 Tax=Undibacterium sp. Ji67W TaxID=3413042 RepID=UPI003BF0DDE8
MRLISNNEALTISGGRDMDGEGSTFTTTPFNSPLAAYGNTASMDRSFASPRNTPDVFPEPRACYANDRYYAPVPERLPPPPATGEVTPLNFATPKGFVVMIVKEVIGALSK